jgi:hypothetical protein
LYIFSVFVSSIFLALNFYITIQLKKKKKKEGKGKLKLNQNIHAAKKVAKERNIQIHEN